MKKADKISFWKEVLPEGVCRRILWSYEYLTKAPPNLTGILVHSDFCIGRGEALGKTFRVSVGLHRESRDDIQLIIEDISKDNRLPAFVSRNLQAISDIKELQP